jgi:predicted nucleic acid-binding protein
MAMNAQHSTENLVIHHKVKDYATWRKGYDEHEKSRLSAGVTNGRVFRRAEDPNDIVILLDVADAAKARAWLGADDLKTVMHKAGVVGAPSIRFAT